MKQSTFFSFLKLFRVQNLVMAVGVIFLVRYGIIEPLYAREGLAFHPEPWLFFAFIFASVLVMAAGYLINDYFDCAIDQINRPQRLYVGKIISSEHALNLFYILNLIAIVVGFVVGKGIGFTNYGSIFLICGTALYFYSLRYKRLLFWGNFAVSLLSGFLVFNVWLFALLLLKNTPEDYFHVSTTHSHLFHDASFFILAYTFFCFVITFIREITKDIEDTEGDRRLGCKSFVICWGLPKTQNLLLVLTVVLMLCVGVFQYLCYTGENLVYILSFSIFIHLPLIFYIYRCFNAETSRDFHFLSIFLKVIMLFGLLSMLLVRFFI